ncbi:N-terminal phage integrase SAM-like domain-containing protein [Streptomyces sp. NPDC001700]
MWSLGHAAPPENDARTALHRYRAGRWIGVSADPNQTVSDYLVQWLAAKRLRLKATTWVRYRDYIHHDLIPALGPIRLDELAYEHIHHYVQGPARRRPRTPHRVAHPRHPLQRHRRRRPPAPTPHQRRPAHRHPPPGLRRAHHLDRPRRSASCVTTTPTIRTSPT